MQVLILSLARLQSRTDVAISSNRSLPVLSDGAAVISPSGVEDGRSGSARGYQMLQDSKSREYVRYNDRLGHGARIEM